MASNGNIELELADALSEDTTYELVYSGGEEAQTMDFTYEKATPTAVNVLTEKVAAQSGDVQLKSEVLAGDADVTEDFDVTYSSDLGSEVLDENGTVDTSELQSGDTFLVRATVGSGDDAVESELQVVVAESSMADSYQFFTINENGTVDSDLEEEDAVTSVDNADSTVGKHVVPHVEDQFGEIVSDDSGNAGGEFQFESLTPETMLVDENSGQIKGVYDEGTAEVKVTAPGTNFEQVVNVDVQAPAKADSFELSETSIDTVDTAGEQYVTVTVQDQYGEPLKEEKVSVSKDSDAVEVVKEEVTTNADGEATVTVDPVEGESGEATVEVQVSDLESQTITVNVEEAGSAVNYDITNTGEDLVYDKNEEDELSFSVYGVDENGNPTTSEAINNVEFSVEDSEGTEYTADGQDYLVKGDSFNVADAVSKNNLKGVGEYTLTASKNGFEYGTVSFEVVNTESKLAEVQFEDNSFVIDENSNLADKLENEGVTLSDQNGEEFEPSDENTVNNELKSAISDVSVANDDLFTVNDGDGDGDDDNNAYDFNLKSSGETVVNVTFTFDDVNGETITQTESFNVKSSIDTDSELDTAVTNTKAGDTITLGGDIDLDSTLEISESLTINGTSENYGLTLSGEDTDNKLGKPTVSVLSDDVTLTNLTVNRVAAEGRSAEQISAENEKVAGEFAQGIKIDSATNVTVTNNTITASGNNMDVNSAGLYVDGTKADASTITYEGNTINGFQYNDDIVIRTSDDTLVNGDDTVLLNFNQE